MQFTTFTVGRSETADVCISDETISRRHLEMTVTRDRRIYIVDAGSSGGTYLWRHESWQELKQGFVNIMDLLRLGSAERTVKTLMALIPDLPPQTESDLEPVSFKPRRSSQTGEVFVD